MYCKPKCGAILFKIIRSTYYVLFNFGHIRRWDQFAVHILLFSYLERDTALGTRLRVSLFFDSEKFRAKPKLIEDDANGFMKALY